MKNIQTLLKTIGGIVAFAALFCTNDTQATKLIAIATFCIVISKND